MSLTTQKQLLNEDETAEVLSIKPQTLASWRCRGVHDLAFIKIGRSIRYRRSDIEDFLERNTSTCATR